MLASCSTSLDGHSASDAGVLLTDSTSSSLPRPEIPAAGLVAVPLQNREDPAKQQFQIKLMNRTDERFEVTSVRFVWDGFTTDVVPKDSIVVGGQSLDLPVPFPGAVCAGDGSAAIVPPMTSAVVEVGLADGTTRLVPVVDHWHLARELYLDDCLRQRIERVVTVEWTDLRRIEVDGRPVTTGVLRLTRRDGDSPVRVWSVAGTIPYRVEFPDRVDPDPVGAPPLVELGPDQSVVDVAMRFTENRCDPHALAEVKQPFQFVAQIDLGDGVVVAHLVRPDRADETLIRRTANEACVVTGKVVEPGG